MTLSFRASALAGAFLLSAAGIWAAPSSALADSAAQPGVDGPALTIATESDRPEILPTEPGVIDSPAPAPADAPLSPLAEVPATIIPQGLPLVEMVAAMRDATPRDREERCLATGIYFEAKSETLEGQLAVARVIIARTESGRFPTTICGVLTQRGQFSFIRGGVLPAVPRTSIAWQNAIAIARIAEQEAHQSPVEGALFFHAAHVAPGWRLTRMARVGNHIFYR